MAGISRSVTLVIAYLMKHLGMGFKQALSMVQSKRKKVKVTLNRSIPIQVSSANCKNYKAQSKAKTVAPDTRRNQSKTNTQLKLTHTSTEAD
jgi:protein-tyrosine phosphatase